MAKNESTTLTYVSYVYMMITFILYYKIDYSAVIKLDAYSHGAIHLTCCQTFEQKCGQQVWATLRMWAMQEERLHITISVVGFPFNYLKDDRRQRKSAKDAERLLTVGDINPANNIY